MNKFPTFKLNFTKYNKQWFKLKNKNFIITLNDIGLTFYVYNGKTYIPLKIIKDMVGYTFGEFITTRKNFSYKKKQHLKKKKK